MKLKETFIGPKFLYLIHSNLHLIGYTHNNMFDWGSSSSSLGVGIGVGGRQFNFCVHMLGKLKFVNCLNRPKLLKEVMSYSS